MKKWICAVVALAATAAVAGSVDTSTVSVWTDSSGQLSANGTFKPTRNSTDTKQYIGCSFYAYDTGSFFAVCYATSASGQYASCSTTDANMLKVVATLNPASYLYFVANSDGTCDRVITSNASYGL